MSGVHIYTAELQPATRFCDRSTGEDHWIEVAPRQLVYTSCCKRRRWAQNANVQVYYDCLIVSCKPGHGCKVKS